MKPVLLVFNGLRSYVEPQTIDFTDKDFIAILGDTGSGKSTVLDAMCYGLYNRCSWRSGTVSDLIAHGGDGTLSVAFTFRVGAGVWRVERSTSSRGGAPAHKLVAVDTDAVVATGATAVTAQIRRIIGLDYDTFLRSVILPQGRFQELLCMGDTDRSKILKSLLGLDQLSAVRDHAQALHTRLAARLAAYRERRAAFIPNPATAMTQAAERQHAAGERLDVLQAAQDAVATAATTASQARNRQTVLDTARARLTTAMPAHLDAAYQTILAAAADITTRRDHIDREHHDTDLEQQQLQGELDKADQEGTGVADTAAAVSTLTHLAEQLPQLDAQAKRLDQEQRQVGASKALLDDRRNDVAARKEAAAAAKRTLDEAILRVGVAEQAHRAATEALTGMRQATEAAGQAERRHTDCLQEADEFKAAAKAAAAEADRAVAAADADQARSSKLHAAATAAEDCSPGDPCPVCARELPEDFIAPSDDATKAAAVALRAARAAATQATKTAAAAAERARIAEQETLVAVATSVQTTAAQLTAATAEVRALLGDVDLQVPDEQLVRHLTDAITTAAAERDAAMIAHNDAHDRHTGAASELPVLEEAHTRREAAYTKERAGHQDVRAGLDRAAHTMPPAFRPEPDLALPDVAGQRERAVQRQIELKRHCDRLAATRVKIIELQTATSGLDREHHDRVTGPATDLRRQLDTLSDRVTDAQTILGIAAHRPRPADASLPEEAAWSTSVIQHAAELVAACDRAAQAERRAAAEADEAAERIRGGCQADDDAHLERLIRAASTAHHIAGRDLARATAQQPLADELDRRIQAAEPTVTALADLVTLLSPGNFITHAVRQRQRALLGAANHTLRAISGDRFGFADNFRIVDTDTAQERDVKTLSGGETFQASLALALAVVELASRASGRVDSLFLDEGFGSLDSGVLQEALNTLAEHSTAGRLVTVISHMRPIAEITNHVLVVERTFTGSRAHWASPEEREQIINDDLNRGLLG